MSHDGLRRLSGAIAKSPKTSVNAAGLGTAMRCYAATYAGAETVDTNLSQITIGNSNFRFVPRLSSAWTTAPSAGTTILVASIGGSLIILGIQLGNITKAQV